MLTSPSSKPSIDEDSGERQDAQIVQVLNVVSGQAENISQTIYVGDKRASLEQLLQGCQAQISSVISAIDHKYAPDLYVNRAIEEEIGHFLDTPVESDRPHCLLLIAPAGSGKTNLLANLARIRVTFQPTVLLLGGSCYLGAESGLLGAIRAEMENASSALAFRSPSDALHSLNRAGQELGRDVLILIDAINEHEEPIRMRKALEHLLTQVSGKQVKLVITCRDHYWNLFKGRFWEGKTHFAVMPGKVPEVDQFYEFTVEEHQQALKLYFSSPRYQITGHLSGQALEQCRHPLLLRFFCEAYKGQYIGEGVIEDIRLKELFDRYWAMKLASVAERQIQQGDERTQDWLAAKIGSYLLNLASYMLQTTIRTVPLRELSLATGVEEDYGSVRSLFGRIRDEYVILEEQQLGDRLEKAIHVAFVYEEFMEYVMALSLIQAWEDAGYDEAEILDQIEVLTRRYASFAQVFGVVIYLALMLRESRGLTLWSSLLSRGAEWQTAITEVIKKLPADQLDAGVFDALSQMLQLNDINIRVKVLDLLKIQRIGAAAPSAMVSLVGQLVPDHYVGRRIEGEDLQLSRRAILALANMPIELAVPYLVRGLAGFSSPVNLYSERILLNMGVLAVEPLIRQFEDEALDEEIRRGIATVLEQIGDLRAIPPLVALLKQSTYSGMFWTVGVALHRLGWSPTDDEDRAWMLVSRGGYIECVRLHPDLSLTPLCHKLKLFTNSHDIAVRIISALSVSRNPGAVDVLLSLLDEKYIAGGIRAAAILALGKLRDTRGFESVLASLKSDSLLERTAAALSLGHFGDSRALSPLLALKTSSKELKLAQIRALGKLGDNQATPFLVNCLRDSEPEIREAAADSLGQLKDLEAVQPLIVSLQDEDETVRMRAAFALRRIGDPIATAPLKNLLEDDCLSVRRAAAEALGEPVKPVGPVIVVGLGGVGIRTTEFLKRELLDHYLLDSSIVVPAFTLTLTPAEESGISQEPESITITRLLSKQYSPTISVAIGDSAQQKLNALKKSHHLMQDATDKRSHSSLGAQRPLPRKRSGRKQR